MGTDGRGYLFFRSPIDGSPFSGATWMAKITPTSFDGWWLAPNYLGPMHGEPSVAVSPADNQVYVASRNGLNRWFYARVTQGAGNTWFPLWSDTGGVLVEADLGVGNDGVYVAGRAEAGLVWWWQQSTQPTQPGWWLNGSGATGKVTTSPDVSAGSQSYITPLAGGCPDPPTVFAGGAALDCVLVWPNSLPNFSHTEFTSCRIDGGNNPDPQLTITILRSTEPIGTPVTNNSQLVLRIVAGPNARIETHSVECQARGNWPVLWRNLRVVCTPTISSVQFNGQNTNTYIVGANNSFTISGSCFAGVPLGNTTRVTIVDALLTVQSVTDTQISGRGWVNGVVMTGARTLRVIGASGGAATTTVFGTRLSVTRVAFKNSFPITRDVAGASSLPAAPDPPVWTSSPAVSDPAGYVQGASLTVDATISASPSPPSSVPGVRLEGNAPGLGKLVKNGVTISGSSTVVTDIPSTFVFPAGTKFHNPLTIAWSTSPDGIQCGSNCAIAGDSSNEVYITLTSPTMLAASVMLPCGQGGSCIPLTILRLAVGNDGANTPSQALERTWSHFRAPSPGAMPSVRGWNGRPFFYYGAAGAPAGFTECAYPTPTSPGYLGILLQPVGSGQCTMFALLLRAALAANGIQTTLVEIEALPLTGPEAQPLDVGKVPVMIVKNWTMPAVPELGMFYEIDPVFAYFLKANVGDDLMFPPRSDFGELVNEAGVPGQNMSTPGEKIFGLHFILRVNDGGLVAPWGLGTYLDGAYGLTYTDALNFQLVALDGYALKLFDLDDEAVWKTRSTTSALRVRFRDL